MTDIEIAQNAKLKPITDIAAGLGIAPEELEPYRASILQMAELTRLTLTPWRRFRFTWFAALDYRSKKK